MSSQIAQTKAHRLAYLKIGAQAAEELDGRPRLEVRVEILPERRGLDHRGEVGEHAWRVADLLEHVDLEIRRERIGQAHVARKRAQYEIAHLDAVGRDDVAEAVVVVAEELGEIVQQD